MTHHIKQPSPHAYHKRTERYDGHDGPVGWITPEHRRVAATREDSDQTNLGHGEAKPKKQRTLRWRVGAQSCQHSTVLAVAVLSVALTLITASRERREHLSYCWRLGDLCHYFSGFYQRLYYNTAALSPRIEIELDTETLHTHTWTG